MPNLAATLKKSFEGRCAQLRERPDGAGLVVRARLAAVEAYKDAAMSMLPDNTQAAAEAVQEAREQLERGRQEAAGDAADAALSESDRLLRGARLRVGLCSEDRSEAWRVFSDCLEVTCVESLPLQSRVDLVAGLIIAGKDAESKVVLSSLRTAVATGIAAQAIVAEGLTTLHACGVPDAAITRIRESLGVRGWSDAEQ